jgi:hypothetical protein
MPGRPPSLLSQSLARRPARRVQRASPPRHEPSTPWHAVAASDAGPFVISDFAEETASPAPPPPASGAAPAPAPGPAPASGPAPAPAVVDRPLDRDAIDADLAAINADAPPVAPVPDGRPEEARDFLREAKEIAPKPTPRSEPQAPAPRSESRGHVTEHPHAIFERMGRSMSQSTSFDLGSVALDRRMDAFDAELRSGEQPQPTPGGGEEEHELSDDDVAADIAAITIGGLPDDLDPDDETGPPTASTPAAPEAPDPAHSDQTDAEGGTDMANRLAELEREITHRRTRQRTDSESVVRPPDTRAIPMPVEPTPGAPMGAQPMGWRPPSRSPSDPPPELSPLVAQARQRGVPEHEIRAIVGATRVDRISTGMGAVDLATAAVDWLSDGGAWLLEQAIALSPLSDLYDAARDLARRSRRTVAIGVRGTGGLETGLTGGVGIFVDEHGLGLYGTAGTVEGVIDSIGASIVLTVIDGDRDVMAGRSTGATVSVDLSEGPGISGTAIVAPDGTPIGISAGVSLGIGVPALSALEGWLDESVTVVTPAQSLATSSASTAYAAGAFAVAASNDIPLDPGNGGRSIGPDAMEPGDIIVMTGNAAVSRAIRLATDSKVSHAALYIGDGEVVEAIGSGVVRRSLAQSLHDANLAVALRRPGLSAAQRQQIVDFAVAQVGRSYDVNAIFRHAKITMLPSICRAMPAGAARTLCNTEALRVRLGVGEEMNDNEFICNELVLRAYQEAGASLTGRHPELNDPQDIVEMQLDGRLHYVGHLLTP